MKDNEFKRMLERYKDGNSTLEEENFLFNNVNNSEPSLKAWSTFVKNNKVETPEDFNGKLWKSFQNKKTIKRRRLVRILSLAASVIILISFFIGNRGQREQSYSEKERILNQALGMFDNLEQKETQYNIFYENEMIVVYTVTE